MNVNIGAGESYIPGWTNVDIVPWADVSLDLSTDRLPFEDGSVDCVFSFHTIEHIPDYFHAMSEMHRVLKDGGWLLIGVPYVTSTRYHLVNPYHLHNFSEMAFDFFDERKMKGSAVEAMDVRFSKAFHRFVYFRPWRFLPGVRTFGRLHLLNVVRSIDVGLIANKERYHAPTRAEVRAMRRRFNECLAARILYPVETGSGQRWKAFKLRPHWAR